jgi:CRP/FNR family transcriptional regulator
LRGLGCKVETKGHVFTEGDPTTYVYRVETGAVALYKVLADGQRQIVGFAYPGDFIGLGAHGEHLMNAQAIKPTRLRCLPVATLRQLSARDPLIGFKLYEALARDLAATRDLVFTKGRRSPIERVAGFLLAFSRRNGENGHDRRCFDLPMTRTDIGDFLGLSVETVSRTFTNLRMHGLIQLPCSNYVKLVDIERLQSIAADRSRAAGLGRLGCDVLSFISNVQHQASAPGEPPATDTGRLISSGRSTAEIDGDTVPGLIPFTMRTPPCLCTC